MKTADVLLPDPKVLERYNVSAMTLWRWDNKNKELGFPAPVVINKRKYRRLAELVAWEQALPRKQEAAERDSLAIGLAQA